MKKYLLIATTLFAMQAAAQQHRIPASYSNVQYDEKGKLFLLKGDERFYADTMPPRYTLSQLAGNAKGTEDGVELDFGNFKGTITYGIIPYGLAPHPLPVYRLSRALTNGKISINIKNEFKSPYDMVGWQQKGQLSFGYRLTDDKGMIVYDGVVSVIGKGPFVAAPTIYEGPFINNLSHQGCIISFETAMPVATTIALRMKGSMQQNLYNSNNVAASHHEITIDGLQAATTYEYTVNYGSLSQTYSFTTAPNAGARKPFVFGYTSDSRHANGGGERMIYGANGYIMKKIAALAHHNKAAFIQFTGDMINGYTSTKEEQMVQYTNWKKSIQAFWHYMPVYAAMGNHEALGYIFKDSKGANKAFIDKFPYETESAEAAFRSAFVNPISDLESEDGSKYDPDVLNADFPSYKESVFHYTYDNVAMVVLNSDYWYAPNGLTGASGNLHAYIMDNQLAWLEKTIAHLEKNKKIDHIFVTQHTPVFPNGGHVGDDMWYRGDNNFRPFIAGKPVDKGIIERRDEYLDILINKSKKVIAVLTGDEHNYNRLQLTKEVPIYPENWDKKKLNVSRSIFQINNGAAGAPYYAQEQAPWSAFTKAFSVENALCLFYVDGKKVKMKVINPDTLNTIDEIDLR
jgi:hypothetical protein